MSGIDFALPRIEREEGFRALPYTDTEGHTTIGFGFDIAAGISEGAAEALLVAQLQELDARLMNLTWYNDLDEVRQSVCLDIAFNNGFEGLLKFPRMIAALQAKDWMTASAECQVQNPELTSRYAALARILETGAA